MHFYGFLGAYFVGQRYFFFCVSMDLLLATSTRRFGKLVFCVCFVQCKRQGMALHLIMWFFFLSLKTEEGLCMLYAFYGLSRKLFLDDFPLSFVFFF